jgi:hypothetical protein
MTPVSEYMGTLRLSRVFKDEDLKVYVTYCYHDEELIAKDIFHSLQLAEDYAEDWVR